MNKLINPTSKTRFIYFSPLSYCNVFVTQVINWLNLYQTKGITFDLWRISSIKHILSGKEKEDTQTIRKNYNGKVGKLFFAPPRFLIGSFFNSIVLIFFIFPRNLCGKKVLIQIRTAELWKPLKFIKMLAPTNIKIIFDARAAGAEELIYTFRNTDDKRSKKKIKRSLNNEKVMVSIADKVFCVSNVLINYYLEKDPNLNKSKFYLYPCSSDSSLFYYSPELRTQIRKEYKIEQKKVIIYSGGLEMKWHIPDKIFELFAGLLAIDNTYFLIVLSPDLEIGKQYLNKYGIPEATVLIKSVSNSEVVKYLCASDISLLLRDDVPMNNVSSPTKFAEYILTGLPVIISENVGDFSTFVRENKLGYVYDNRFTTNSYHEINEFIRKNYEQLLARRQWIAELGVKKYSKSINLEEIIAQYHSTIELYS